MLSLMLENSAIGRSPELMQRRDTALVVIDVQEKLIGLIDGRERLVWNVRRLIDGAKTLGLPVAATEQYPRGLGPTVSDLADRLGEIPAKLRFSACECQDVFTRLAEAGVHKFLLTGIETHVCVQQTALDLLASGFRVYLAVDAVGSRFPLDYEIALRRMESAGATLTTTEAALFEWCEVAGTPEFKAISQLVRETPPDASAARQ